MASSSIETFGPDGATWSIPSDGLDRQAVASLRGYVYQLHQTAAQWIALAPGDLLHIEVAEDFSRILQHPGQLDAILETTQVKDTRESGSVTLNSPDVLDFIANVHALRKRNPGRTIRGVFLTTSPIGLERKLPLQSKRKGLEVWKAVAEGEDAQELKDALLQRLPNGRLKTAILSEEGGRFEKAIVQPLSFICGAPGWETLQEANRAALVEKRGLVNSTAERAGQAYDSILAKVMATALSPNRQLSHDDFLSVFGQATAVAVPSQAAFDYFVPGPTTRTVLPSDEELRALAQALVDNGRPPSIPEAFGESTREVMEALDIAENLQRSLLEGSTGGSAKRLDIEGLTAHPDLKHLIVATAGSGKTHTLWRLAKAALASHDLIPLFLPVGGAADWNEVRSVLKALAPSLEPDQVLQDARVCVLLDGWSEFADAGAATEKNQLLRLLHSTRVIGSGKFAGPSDGAFKIWNLEPLSIDQVQAVLTVAHPGAAKPAAETLDLFRLPLLLLLRVLSGRQAATPGELLRRFHNRIARDLPEQFSEALFEAVAELFLANERGFGRLESELKAAAKRHGVASPLKHLKALGSILERNGRAQPVHDLYWTWLAGQGLVTGNRMRSAIGPLRTRESFDLAFQSGATVASTDIDAVIDDDVILAAQLYGSRPNQVVPKSLASAIEAALNDPRLAVRNRGGLAALALRHPDWLKPSLEVLSSLCTADLYLPAWSAALDVEVLFARRDVVAAWLGAQGTDLVLDAIAERGSEAWVPWLEQMAELGKLKRERALAVALACDPQIPAWGQPAFPALLEQPWRLRPARNRGANRALAREFAVKYEDYVGRYSNTSGWLDLNDILVACGDEDVFRFLLSRYPGLSPRAQEYLGYAIIKKGGSWVAAFQKVAFETPNQRYAGPLSDAPAPEIDDQTARQWIASGHEKLGWKALIERHGEAMIPELVSLLPDNLAGPPDIPALNFMAELDTAPPSLVPELWGRIRGTMYPKPMESLIHVTAASGTAGIEQLVRIAISSALPAYFSLTIVKLLQKWRAKTGHDAVIEVPGLPRVTAIQLVIRKVMENWEEHFSSRILAQEPDLAIAWLPEWSTDDDRADEVLKHLRVSSYSAALLDRMLATPKLAARIPDVFGEAFDAFPADALARCHRSPDVSKEMLWLKLSATSNPLHRQIHCDIVDDMLSGAMNIHHLRYAARMLRDYSIGDVMALLTQGSRQASPHWLWLILEIEAERGERLLNERGTFRQ